MTKKYHPEGYIQKCIVCKEDVYQTDDKKMIAIESPYLNLYVHLLCYKEIENNLKEFMTNNLAIYLKESK
jgi:hypothetical protein